MRGAGPEAGVGSQADLAVGVSAKTGVWISQALCAYPLRESGLCELDRRPGFPFKREKGRDPSRD